MGREESIQGENYLWNGIGFVSPFLLAGIHAIILENVNKSSQNASYLLLAIFGLFWPIFIIGLILTTRRSSSPRLQIAAQCALISSFIAAVLFYGCAPALLFAIS